MKKTPSVGDTVAFVLPAGHARAGEIIPANITHVASEQAVSLSPSIEVSKVRHEAAILCSDVPFFELPAKGKPAPRSWHWPADAKPAAPVA